MRQVESQFSRSFDASRRTAMKAIILWLGIAPLAVLAQVASTGMIGGTVSDPSGSPIPGANVTITSTATGGASATLSNSIGGFSVVGLTSGQYEVAVVHPGFSAFKETGIFLESVGSDTV